MRYIVVDLEATCWENVRDFGRMETIEIGAVELPSANSPPSREFSRFIRPVAEPHLSEFCQRLTSIRQRDVDQADYFWAVFPEFTAWIGRRRSSSARGAGATTDAVPHRLPPPRTGTASLL